MSPTMTLFSALSFLWIFQAAPTAWSSAQRSLREGSHPAMAVSLRLLGSMAWHGCKSLAPGKHGMARIRALPCVARLEGVVLSTLRPLLYCGVPVIVLRPYSAW